MAREAGKAAQGPSCAARKGRDESKQTPAPQTWADCQGDRHCRGKDGITRTEVCMAGRLISPLPPGEQPTPTPQ